MAVLYHASSTPGIQALEPRVSNHGKPLVYLSDCRENVLVYLSNAVEKFCREKGLPPQSFYYKWGSYGFSPSGILQLDEYWPGATEETYGGVSGYVYTAEGGPQLEPLPDIPHAYISREPVPVTGCEFVPDALAALREAAAAGKLILRSYEENSEKMLQWIRDCTRKEYNNPESPGYYREFLQAKFPALNGD